MAFLLNILFGLLAGFGASYVCRRLGVGDPIAFVVGLIVGIIVFLANLAVRVL